MIRVQIQLTEEQARRLKELAHREDTSVAGLVRRAIDLWLYQGSGMTVAEGGRPRPGTAGQPPTDHARVAEPVGEYVIEASATVERPRPGDLARSVLYRARPPRDLQDAPPPLEPGDRLTAAEFMRRYEAMPHIKKAELIEGVVYMPSPVRVSHAAAHGRLMIWLGTYSAATPGVQLADNATLRMDLDNVVQPDALLRLEPTAGGRSRVSPDDYLEGAPELIAEVATSSAAYDLYDKLRVYRRNRVQEYLVWQVLEERLDWWHWVAGEYVPIPVEADGLMRSRVFPGLWLDPQAMLSGNLQTVLARLQEGLASEQHQTYLAAPVKALGD